MAALPAFAPASHGAPWPLSFNISGMSVALDQSLADLQAEVLEEAKQLSAKPSACAHSLTRKPRMRTFDDMSTATFFSAAVEPVFFSVSGRQNRKGVRTSGGTQARADERTCQVRMAGVHQWPWCELRKRLSD